MYVYVQPYRIKKSIFSVLNKQRIFYLRILEKDIVYQ